MDDSLQASHQSQLGDEKAPGNNGDTSQSEEEEMEMVEAEILGTNNRKRHLSKPSSVEP